MKKEEKEISSIEELFEGYKGTGHVDEIDWGKDVGKEIITDDEKGCYLVAKRFTDEGCLAVKVKSDKALASLVSYLGLRTLDKGIQILTVSNPEMFGEYKPYHFVSSEKEFICKVLD